MPISLVTGAAGFIGSHVAVELLLRGHKVVGLDDLSGGFRENLPSGVDFEQASILDHARITALFDLHKFDFVFHLAAYAAEGLSPFIRRFNYTNNLIGSMNLINASVNHGVKCFVFTSSIAVYGRNQVPMKEDMIPQPEDPYGIAKYAVEQDLRAAAELFGLPWIVFRPHNVYGERQNIADKYRNVVGIFMNQILNDQPLTIFGDGTQTRAFTYVSDVAPVIAQSVDTPEVYDQVFNIGADTPCSVNHLAITVAKAMGVASPRIVHFEPRHEVIEAWSDHTKVRKQFGLNSAVGLEDGISRMARWVRTTGKRRAISFKDIEIWRELPEAWTKPS
ncbi:MAG: NAD-dependent epimerase/dehydratase family protein [Planctomycetes bacterium]|nr:NAD-dependent epimerase/dehydratase family protein [Planctomycetota bacterium]